MFLNSLKVPNVGIKANESVNIWQAPYLQVVQQGPSSLDIINIEERHSALLQFAARGGS